VQLLKVLSSTASLVSASTNGEPLHSLNLVWSFPSPSSMLIGFDNGRQPLFPADVSHPILGPY